MQDIVELFCDAILGLEYLHLRGVIHRDLKSENLLLTISDENKRTLKIADFGISMLDTKLHQLGTDICQGTPMYMAPETHDNGRKYSNASDLYAIGCVLYELCTLEHPFHIAQNMDELKMRQYNSIYVPVDGYGGGYAKCMGWLVDRLLEPNMKRRAKMAEVLQCPIMTNIFSNQKLANV